VDTLRSPPVTDYFPHRFCINLARRPERWASVSQEFRRGGFAPVTRFEAFDARQMTIPDDWIGRPGAFGCLESHKAIVRHARDQGFPHVLIFEDDVVFDPDLEIKLVDALGELPSDWDMFSFGGCHRMAPVRVTEHLYRMTKTYATHAYVVRDTIYDAFLEINGNHHQPVDMNNYLLQQRFKCYCAIPHLAWQQDDWSDIQGELESHWAMRESLILVGSEIERLLADTALILAYRPDSPNRRANLMHLLDFYHQWFPTIEVAVVAGPDELTGVALPDWCRHIESDRDREQMFRAGFRQTPNKGTYIFSDANVRPSQYRYVRPNLLMCGRHGGTTFFDTLVRLSEADSDLVRRDRFDRVDMTRYAPEPIAAPKEGAFALTRTSLEHLKGGARKDLFRAPNRGLILT